MTDEESLASKSRNFIHPEKSERKRNRRREEQIFCWSKRSLFSFFLTRKNEEILPGTSIFNMKVK
jgi:hypothetical protein